MGKPNKSEESFQAYLRQPVIQQAIGMVAKDSLTENLLRDCFMAGAGYAIQRCKEEHHTAPKVPDGHVIVPVEPTQQMLHEGCKAGLSNATLFDDTRYACERAVWNAMVANVNLLN